MDVILHVLVLSAENLWNGVILDVVGVGSYATRSGNRRMKRSSKVAFPSRAPYFNEFLKMSEIEVWALRGESERWCYSERNNKRAD
jgi:hypothetical protein